MPRLQSLTQQHFLERQDSPMSSRMFSGMSGVSEGVPRMHPLTSNIGLANKAGGLIHSLRIRTPKLPGIKLPRI